MNTEIYTKELESPIRSLEEKFGGANALIRAAFAHSFFVSPDKVKKNLVCFPDFARVSREHYPGGKQGNDAVWSGDGRTVRLELNHRAQTAWRRYTGRPLKRRSGYGLRHIWGHPWDPDAYTAGWNFCYMPFWAGMLTEKQHPHEELERAFRQASWNLYFRGNPVCVPPGFVQDPQYDLDAILCGQPVLLMGASQTRTRQVLPPEDGEAAGGNVWAQIERIRTVSHNSWKNIRKATLNLQRRPHEPFGTPNVAAGARSCVNRIIRETGITLQELESLLDEHDLGR